MADPVSDLFQHTINDINQLGPLRPESADSIIEQCKSTDHSESSPSIQHYQTDFDEDEAQVISSIGDLFSVYWKDGNAFYLVVVSNIDIHPKYYMNNDDGDREYPEWK